ncbi:three component ABC system middle component [Clostridium sp.]|uniref:three component ABC system middle component n=1 Tax=Clostridium sp. TaxID=1506 RepID=UPI002627335F|nr:three component ABC system middle component [Clostridium sp.]
MSIEHIQRLSMNPHFYGVLLQAFLSGYNKPCDVRSVFMALPILLYSESRKKLLRANNRSKMETLFNSSEVIGEDFNISGKVRLSGYIQRFEELKTSCKKALIILYSDKKIFLSNYKIILIKPVSYSDYEGTIKNWIRAAYYLGIVFAKTSEDHLNYFLGVDRK